MLTNGEEYRNFIHIQDICEAWYKALNDRLQGVYDLYGEPIKILDLAKIIARLTGAKIRIGEKLSFSPKIIPEREIPGFSTNINLEAGLIDMIDKYKNLKN